LKEAAVREVENQSAMAKALKFHAVVRGKTLPLPDLAAFEGKRVEVIVVEDETEAPPGPVQCRRFGTLAGQFVVPDDFDAPLPADVLAAFEGSEDET
jgi:hypothetical protein